MQLFEQAGFSPQYSKPDPRGSEYGRFMVSMGGRTEPAIKVEHTGERYTLYFMTPEDFSRWSRSL